MIEINNLSKSYQETQALCNISLSVEKGELFGLIGPDGAGKTTLFRILTTLLLADQGTATMSGYDVVKDFRKVRNLVGYMPGRFSLYSDLSVEENLKFFATVFGTTVEQNYDLIHDIYCQIEPFKKRRAGKLSGGMKQKLALSCALIHKPEILVLDEPTTGVDAVSRKEFWELLKKLQSKGITILVSTPYMDEASLCDRVALIQKGRFMAMDTLPGVTSQFKGTLLSVKGDNRYQLLTDLREWNETIDVFAFGQQFHVTVSPAEDQTEALLSYLQSKGHTQIAITPITPGIEDVFMSLMGNPDNPQNN